MGLGAERVDEIFDFENMFDTQGSVNVKIFKEYDYGKRVSIIRCKQPMTDGDAMVDEIDALNVEVRVEVRDGEGLNESVNSSNSSSLPHMTAKRLLLRETAGSYKMEYGQIKAYAAEIEKSNPGSTCTVELIMGDFRQG
ncbi:hypothetical protein GH714_031997 [Hevea brasiliensis]|uniref:Uncharacterized protein n=1 Tax=Hevea brasiliensis TaxID=3981 RepID=A0A6A6LKV9_HEVBR|nr:hypothetical protein GH714_031997 [Hevea brasiliensis]